jgi:phospholipase C
MGTIADLKHVVILMQENRSFDHYGTLRGVRGFAKFFAIFEGTSEIQRMLIGRTITGLHVR